MCGTLCTCLGHCGGPQGHSMDKGVHVHAALSFPCCHYVPKNCRNVAKSPLELKNYDSRAGCTWRGQNSRGLALSQASIISVVLLVTS